MALTINHQTNDISATSGSVTLDGSAAGGATTLLSTTNITTGVTNVDLSLSGSYKTYIIRYSGIKTPSDVDAGPSMRVSTDGGSSFISLSNYIFLGRGGQRTKTGYTDMTNYNSGSGGSTHFPFSDPYNKGNDEKNGIVTIIDPHTSSTQFSMFVAISQPGDPNAVIRSEYSGLYAADGDYDAVQIFTTVNMTTGTIQLYGVS